MVRSETGDDGNFADPAWHLCQGKGAETKEENEHLAPVFMRGTCAVDTVKERVRFA